MRCVPFLLNHRQHQQYGDASHHGAHDHPKHNEPRRGVGYDWRFQGGDDADELHSFIGEQKGTVDAIPGLPVGQFRLLLE